MATDKSQMEFLPKEQDAPQKDYNLYYMPRPSLNRKNSLSDTGEDDCAYSYPAKKSCPRPCLYTGLVLLVLFVSTNVILITLVVTGAFHSVVQVTNAALIRDINETTSAKIHELEEKIAHNDQRIADLTVRSRLQNASLVKLGDDVTSMRTKITNLASTVTKQGNSLVDLGSNLHDVQSKVKDIQAKASQIEARVTSVQNLLQGEINTLKSTVSKCCHHGSTSGGSSLHGSMYWEPLRVQNIYTYKHDPYELQTGSRTTGPFIPEYRLDIVTVNLLPLVTCLFIMWS